ncbi:hypothetical protein AVEN_241769-1 [Araneus ventricosus]|uniref:Uncharacterized protein n=1 Tax=Araneus ventricosus TaxID=182803 RepID=A0A4Y2FH03_ARAVE|nr:hypothetical protein AVEN_241769-1 [Araneus ventricosus]
MPAAFQSSLPKDNIKLFTSFNPKKTTYAKELYTNPHSHNPVHKFKQNHTVSMRIHGLLLIILKQLFYVLLCGRPMDVQFNSPR